MNNIWQYQSRLKTGMDVDWLKTNPGRTAIHQARKQGISVPQLFYKRGLSHVRIRVKDDVNDSTRNPKTDNMTLLEEMKVVVDECLSVGLIPIIAYQALSFKLDPKSDDAINGVVDWWETVAKTFQGYDRDLAFNFVIETTEEVKHHNDRLNLLYQNISDRLRPLDSERIFICAPNKISAPEALSELILPTLPGGIIDPWVMVETHFYAAGPKRDNPKKQWDRDNDGFGDDYEKGLLKAKVNTAKSWSVEQNVPVWIGAIMANNYNETGNPTDFLDDGAPGGGDYTPSQQIKFVRFVTRLLRNAEIPVAWNSDTKFFNREQNIWYSSMAKVLETIIKD